MTDVIIVLNGTANQATPQKLQHLWNMDNINIERSRHHLICCAVPDIDCSSADKHEDWNSLPECLGVTDDTSHAFGSIRNGSSGHVKAFDPWRGLQLVLNPYLALQAKQASDL